MPDEPDYPYIDYNKMVTVTKAWSIWNDLQFSHEIKKAIIGDNYKIGRFILIQKIIINMEKY